MEAEAGKRGQHNGKLLSETENEPGAFKKRKVLSRKNAGAESNPKTQITSDTRREKNRVCPTFASKGPQSEKQKVANPKNEGVHRNNVQLQNGEPQCENVTSFERANATPTGGEEQFGRLVRKPHS